VEPNELERIRERKLRELMGKHSEGAIDKPVEVTDRTLDEFVRKHQLAVVDCWAPWCGPCLMVAPAVEELASIYRGKIVFGKLNVDENPETAERYGIEAIPTFLIFKNGELVDRFTGAMPKRLLEERIKRFL